LTSIYSWHAVHDFKENSMLFELGMLGGIFYLGYRATRPKPRASAMASVTVTTRAEQAGAAGEQIAQAKLAEALVWLCGSDCYLHDGPLVIEHDPGSPFPTAEIDHLAITPFGIFVFETKHWSGFISNGAIPGELQRSANDGTRAARKSPIAQNASKVAFLRRHLPPMWPVDGAGIFTSTDVELSADLPVNLIRVADLPHWLRQQKALHSGKQPVDVARAKAAILRFADQEPFAAERHRKRVKRDDDAG
jgi:hypothetical protein